MASSSVTSLEEECDSFRAEKADAGAFAFELELELDGGGAVWRAVTSSFHC